MSTATADLCCQLSQHAGCSFRLQTLIASHQPTVDFILTAYFARPSSSSYRANLEDISNIYILYKNFTDHDNITNHELLCE
jgi:hypothetical protein